MPSSWAAKPGACRDQTARQLARLAAHPRVRRKAAGCAQRSQLIPLSPFSRYSRRRESIPQKFRPLPNRMNVVLSRNAQLELPAGVQRAASLAEGLALVDGGKENGGAEKIFIIGGASVYAAACAMPGCERV